MATATTKIRTANEVSHDVIMAAQGQARNALSWHHAQAQVGVPVIYGSVKLDVGYRIDLLVENLVIVELKAVDGILPIHEAQLLSYLKLSGKSLGPLINFNVTHLKDGIKRLVCGSGWQ